MGGGQLEHLIIARAKELLGTGQSTQHIEHYPLAASALQCCGGSVTVMLECFAKPQLRVAVFGAGHIGQRVVTLLEQLGAHIRWIDDTARDPHLEGDLQPAAQKTPLERSAQPATVIQELHEQAQVVIVSHDHQLDYELLSSVLNRGIDCFAGVGMIGSKTKWQRFRARLLADNHSAEHLDQIRCPLAQGPATDKQPAAIAIAIVNELLNLAGERDQQTLGASERNNRSSDLSWRQNKIDTGSGRISVTAQPPISVSQFNELATEEALARIMHWCAAPAWAKQVCEERPVADLQRLQAITTSLWQSATETDQLAAFAMHPAIGDVELLRSKYAPQANAEQGQVLGASTQTIEALAKQNIAYRERHGFTFIVFATGKSAEQMLDLLNARINNSQAEEMINAAAEQLKIMQLRLQQTITAN